LISQGYIVPSEPLHIFDPRRNFQLQGFGGRAATTKSLPDLSDATDGLDGRHRS